jgi:phosphatidylglycerophosphate synthase
MPSKYRLRYVFKPVIQALSRPLAKIGISANVATLIMLFHSIVSFVFLVFLENLILFGIFVFLTGIWDGLDGAIARVNKKSSEFGGFFDSFMDRISEFVIFTALLLYFWEEVLWNSIDMKLVVFIMLMASIMISYSRARAETISDGDFDIGLMARSERLFYLFLTMSLSYFIGYEKYFIFLFMILVSLTALYRGIKIYSIIKHESQNELG